jgi:glutathione S-transferase
MDPLVLYIGEKNVSSWSMRGYLGLVHKRVPFEERLVDLVAGRGNDLLARVSPTGLVPVLHHGTLVVPDSLAILEYLEEAFPPPRYPALWPSDLRQRARARWLAATMHSGFAAMRAGMSFHTCFWPERPRASRAALDDATELLELLERALAESPSGPFLAGEFGAADIMYATALVRIDAYRVPLDDTPRARDYLRALLEHATVRVWLDAALALPPVLEE